MSTVFNVVLLGEMISRTVVGVIVEKSNWLSVESRVVVVIIV